MGAQDFHDTGFGKTAQEVFDRLVRESQWRSGHEYSGEIGMKSSFKVIELPKGLTVDRLTEYQSLSWEWYNYEQRHHYKAGREPKKPTKKIPEQFKAIVKQIEQMYDKWGPAICIKASPTEERKYRKQWPDLKGKRGNIYHFIGIASC